MKRLFYIWLSLFVCAFGDSYAGEQTSPIREQRPVRGNGRVATTQVAIQPFDKLLASNLVKVTLVDSLSDEVRIVADDNIIHLVVVEQKGSLLHIGVKPNARILKADIKVFVPNNSSICEMKATSMSQIIVTTPLTANNQTLSVSSYGQITADIVTNQCCLQASSNGSLNVKVKAKSCNATSSSNGRIEAEVTVEQCTVSVSSAGEVILAGSAMDLEAACSSGATLRAAALVVEQGKVTASSGASANVNCIDHLVATASSGGRIFYTGNCISECRSSSGGSINKR